MRVLERKATGLQGIFSWLQRWRWNLGRGLNNHLHENNRRAFVAIILSFRSRMWVLYNKYRIHCQTSKVNLRSRRSDSCIYIYLLYNIPYIAGNAIVLRIKKDFIHFDLFKIRVRCWYLCVTWRILSYSVALQGQDSNPWP